MGSKIQFGAMVDGEFRPVPAWLLSRGVWLSALLALTNAYEFLAFTDPELIRQMVGLTIPPNWAHSINVCGNVLGLYFRIRAKQPLGEAAKGGRITPEELRALEEKIRARMAEEPQ